MNKFDTLKLKIHGACAKIKQKFSSRLKSRINPGTWNFERLNYLEAPFRPGINQIAEGENKVVVEVSSKVLGPRYPDLIHRGNFREVLEALSEYLDIGTEADILEYSEVCRCHITENVPVTRAVHEYLLPLACICNPDFKTVPYKDKEVSFEEVVKMKERRLQTVIYQRNFRNGRDNERLTFYEKEEEMRKNRNDRFYGSLDNFDQVLDYFKTHLRAEMQLSSFDSIRKAFKIPEPRLGAVLTSPAKPIYELLERIRNGSKQSATEYYPPRSSLNRLEKDLGMETLIQNCNFDVGLIKQQLKRHIKGNPSGQMRRYAQKAEEMKRAMVDIENGSETGLLGEILEKLKAA